MTEKIIAIETAELIPNPKVDKLTWWSECSWFYVDTYASEGFYLCSMTTLDNDYPAPRQALLAKFIRERYGEDVEARPVRYAGDARASGYSPCINGNVIWTKNKFEKYEDALEYALYQSLLSIKETNNDQRTTNRV
jgi:hypothetical protein